MSQRMTHRTKEIPVVSLRPGLSESDGPRLLVSKLDCGFGPARSAWTLTEQDTGACLMIGDHGCVSPTRRGALEEANKRMERGDGYSGVDDR